MSELWAPAAMDKIGKGGCRASPCFVPGFKAKRISLRPWQSTGGDPKQPSVTAA